MAERQRLMEQREQAALKSILAKLEQAMECSNQGRVDEAETIAQELIDSLNAELQLDDRVRAAKGKCRQFDRSVLPEKGGILGENARVVLRAISDADHENWMKVAFEDKKMQSAIDQEAFQKDLWRRFTTENVAVFTICDRYSGEFIGYCGIKDLSSYRWELVMELAEKFRGIGYGYSALVVMLDSLEELTGEVVYRARIEADNYASQGITEKIGGRPDGISEMFMHGEELEKFQEENKNLVDDRLKKVAEEFGVEPLDLIGHLLEYRIEWRRNEPLKN